MISGNNYYMKNSNTVSQNLVFYFKKRIMKFKNPNQLISDDDIMNLFFFLVNLIKKNTEMKIEEKYLNKIAKLEYEIKKMKNL